MLNFLKENRRILLCTALALAAGTLLGGALSLPRMAQQQTEPAEQAGRIGEASILPATAIERQVCYLACGHLTEGPLPDADALVGMTRRELAQAYPEAAITTFTSERVRLVVSAEGYCPAHLLLMADAEGALAVYQMQEDTLQMETVLALPLAADAFDAETAAALAAGVPFDTMDEINAYLESMES